ncbi:serine hydrolase domain-containing protein [Lysobacter sp. CA199]|uniref:serine hydrolase domain-containing protein n=1 Tax=Lysobacter sp. CA199 TaxID=3455608 RepID=UPI003F8D491E
MTRSGARAALALSALLLGHAVAAPAGDAPPRKDCRAERAGERRFCETVEAYADLLRLPGYALAVANHGKIVYLHTGGYADIARRKPVRADSIFPIASVTKTFTATLMLQYAAERRIALDDYIADYPQIDDASAWLYDSPDIRIRHVLSHTSEGAAPGDGYSYNGNRFNYVYGVFAKLTGEKDYAKAFAGEVDAQILKRIGLRDTLAGMPEPSDSAHTARIVTPYRYDAGRASFIADDDLQGGHRRAYPNSGMLSTLADLARYLDALRTTDLAGPDARAMTTPFKLNDGRDSPYALGWFSETWDGRPVQWVYGLGPSYASFVMHVPERRVSLIFLANTDGPTAALRLGYGNALQFPLAAGFLREFAGADIATVALDEDSDALGARLSGLSAQRRREAFAQTIGVAFTRHYADRLQPARSGRGESATALVSMLYDVDPVYFRTPHPQLIALIAELRQRSLSGPMDELARAYDAAGRIDPQVSQDLGDFYAWMGDAGRSVRYRRALLQAPGYHANDATINTAFALGDYYFEQADIAAGRACYWTGIRNAVRAGWGRDFAEAKRLRMTRLSEAARHPDGRAQP